MGSEAKRRKPSRRVGDPIGPAAVLGAVQPVGVDPAVVGGIEDFLETVPVQVDDHRVGLRGFDDIVVFGKGTRQTVRYGQGLPVDIRCRPSGSGPD